MMATNTQLTSEFRLADGTIVTIRPICPDDADHEQAFVRSLSAEARRQRFFSSLRELSPAALYKFTHTNYPSDMALVATITDDGAERQIGVARYASGSGSKIAEFAIVVSDGFQGKGIATTLLQKLFGIAEAAGLSGVEGTVLRENPQMLALARELGFDIGPQSGDASVCTIRKTF